MPTFQDALIATHLRRLAGPGVIVALAAAACATNVVVSPGAGGGRSTTVSGATSETDGVSVESCDDFPSPGPEVESCVGDGCGVIAYCDHTYVWATRCTETSCTCIQILNGGEGGSQGAGGSQGTGGLQPTSPGVVRTCKCQPTAPGVCAAQPKSCCPFVP
jgi:hypothetical protein